ncbi:glycosyltransferase [Cytobacillus sp. FSL R7-0696]|uniref:glycosyltransferase n=1 Tax=Cytobacillus sp. FSL R7-0696 TaxID=2921691 RepID=UPI0030FD06A5
MKRILCNDIHIESHQLTILHYGFDIDDFLLRAAKPANHIRKRKKRQQLLIYTGRLIKAKGVQYLITALSYLKEQNNNWVCWIIGDGEEKQHLQKRTNDYHLRNQILFLGEMMSPLYYNKLIYSFYQHSQKTSLINYRSSTIRISYYRQ